MIDSPSEEEQFNDIGSSPIVENEVGDYVSAGIDDFIPRKTQRKSLKPKKAKVVSDDAEDMAFWSEAKRNAWAAIDTNPNAYYYRHVAPGQKKQTGAWSEKEKQMFFEAMKVHPPSQGKWGLFAQHIPGRVGYQCRNFYHHLLDTGEITALPGELEQIRHRKKKNEPEKAQTKKKQQKKVLLEDEEASEEEEIAIERRSPRKFEINSLTFFSSKLRRMMSKGIDVFSDDESMPLPSENVSQEEEEKTEEVIANTEEENIKSVITQEDNFQDAEEIAELPTENEIKEEEPIKWSSRMMEPWKTRKHINTETIEFPNTATPADLTDTCFEYESARILRTNKENPLNLILFSLPVSSDISAKYINSVRKILSHGSQPLKSQIVQRFFSISPCDHEQVSQFANDVIQSSLIL